MQHPYLLPLQVGVRGWFIRVTAVFFSVGAFWLFALISKVLSAWLPFFKATVEKFLINGKIWSLIPFDRSQKLKALLGFTSFYPTYIFILPTQHLTVDDSNNNNVPVSPSILHDFPAQSIPPDPILKLYQHFSQ